MRKTTSAARRRFTAQRSGAGTMGRFLVAHGANLSAKDNRGKTRWIRLLAKPAATAAAANASTSMKTPPNCFVN